MSTRLRVTWLCSYTENHFTKLYVLKLVLKSQTRSSAFQEGGKKNHRVEPSRGFIINFSDKPKNVCNVVSQSACCSCCARTKCWEEEGEKSRGKGRRDERESSSGSRNNTLNVPWPWNCNLGIFTLSFQSLPEVRNLVCLVQTSIVCLNFTAGLNKNREWESSPEGNWSKKIWLCQQQQFGNQLWFNTITQKVRCGKKKQNVRISTRQVSDCFWRKLNIFLI